MITIEVNDQEIYIEEKTSFVLEINNNIFNFEKIEGEKIYTFDIPAAKNSIIFEHAEYVYIKKEKVYRATIKIGGIPFAFGNLLVQSSRKDYYSISMAVNYFPIAFGDRKLKNNNYADNQLGIEPTNYETHCEKKDAILAASMSPNSVIKFPAFYFPHAYGTNLEWDGPQWGWGYEGDPNEPVDYFREYVANRFVIGDNEIAYNPITLKQYPSSEVEHRYINSLYNTNNLNPVIQLSFLLKKVLETAGYRLTGDCIKDKKLLRVFYYSLKSLDGTPRSLYNSSATNDYEDENFNIFTPSIPLSDHVPDMTNKELLNAYFKLFGTTFYVDSINKTIEISLALNILKAQSIDLTSYILREETDIQSNQENGYKYHLESLDEKEFDQKNLAGEVSQYSSLPTPSASYQGKFYLCKLENEIYECKQSFDEQTKITSWKWNYFSGNDIQIEIGKIDEETEPEEIKPSVFIPSNKTLDPDQTFYSRDILPYINKVGISDLYPTGITTFDLILTYYYDEIVDWSNEGINYKITRCYPTNEYRFPPISDGTIDLKTTGENSLGQNYVKNYIERIQNYETIEMKFLLPLTKVLEVINLLKPQSVNPEMQTRFILVDNIKMLPIQMNFQFTKGSSLILTEIKLAKTILDI